MNPSDRADIQENLLRLRRAERELGYVLALTLPCDTEAMRQSARVAQRAVESLIVSYSAALLREDKP